MDDSAHEGTISATIPRVTRSALRTLAPLLAAALLAAPAARADTFGAEPEGTVIPVPTPSPSGFTVAWKPALLTVRLDDGHGEKFGSDKLQPLRMLARYTGIAKEGTPFFGRAELEGGTFQTDTESRGVGSSGYDIAGRFSFGAATRLFEGVLFIASVGGLVRYQHGAATGGAPTLGNFGILANAEVEYRIYPFITLSIMGEAAVAPFPFAADRNLGDLSDASEVRARIALSFDLTLNLALEVGYDFTRWHNTFTGSTILRGSDPTGQALVVEAREYAATLGLRWKL